MFYFFSGKVGHNLSAARKKDIDDDANGYQSHRKDHVPASPRGQKSKPDSVLQASKILNRLELKTFLFIHKKQIIRTTIT